MRIEVQDVSNVIEIEDLVSAKREILVIQEAGIPGPQGTPGDFTTTTIEPPLEYSLAETAFRITHGTVPGQVIQWNGTEWVATSPAPQRVEYRTVTALEQTSKEIILAHSLTAPAEILFDIAQGGGPQFPDTDFFIDGNSIKWEGMTLDGVLEEGDRIRIVYQ